ncbi:helix-turn-helix transcriptional regulator [Methylocystis parvus]|uniref:Helix-turn-helix domain-containing protein n=1 Tax=Methylocystis parvus TaxID=134 RepID=A0A6B8MDK0_9HYPH|nr:helix-turn-helix domain-containing protein [Methylocystis parvus]QGM99649.1 helix-turn-helix domain-containing protein [Methylocystis parvus]WBK01884.1 helix-turn-helix domain-containing protein [Methylocystis parvus OBBP]
MGKKITASGGGRADVQQAERLVDEAGAAEILQISARTLQAWRMKGGGPRYVRVGRSVRYSINDLNSWIEARKASSTSDNAA